MEGELDHFELFKSYVMDSKFRLPMPGDKGVLCDSIERCAPYPNSLASVNSSSYGDAGSQSATQSPKRRRSQKSRNLLYAKFDNRTTVAGAQAGVELRAT